MNKNGAQIGSRTVTIESPGFICTSLAEDIRREKYYKERFALNLYEEQARGREVFEEVIVAPHFPRTPKELLERIKQAVPDKEKYQEMKALISDYDRLFENNNKPSWKDIKNTVNEIEEKYEMNDYTEKVLKNIKEVVKAGVKNDEYWEIERKKELTKNKFLQSEQKPRTVIIEIESFGPIYTTFAQDTMREKMRGEQKALNTSGYEHILETPEKREFNEEVRIAEEKYNERMEKIRDEYADEKRIEITKRIQEWHENAQEKEEKQKLVEPREVEIETFG